MLVEAAALSCPEPSAGKGIVDGFQDDEGARVPPPEPQMQTAQPQSAQLQAKQVREAASSVPATTVDAAVVAAPGAGTTQPSAPGQASSAPHSTGEQAPQARALPAAGGGNPDAANRGYGGARQHGGHHRPDERGHRFDGPDGGFSKDRHPHHPAAAHRPPARGSFPPHRGVEGETQEVYGALDLGTNNCRLLLARPSRRGFQVVDAFSRIIRLGEGVSQTGALSDAAMARTLEALKVCAAKLERHQVRRAVLVATEACRIASNGAEFLDRVHRSTGLRIDILSREGEARLAVSGCASLIDPASDYALVFDIGGGSSELVWLDLGQLPQESRGANLQRAAVEHGMMAWTSLPIGVVSLAERFGGRHVTDQSFEAMVTHVMSMLAPFEAEHRMGERLAGRSAHLLGTSGTVTTVAGVHLGLPRYDRNRVDGCWMDAEAARRVTYDLLARDYAQRVAEPCIGRDRADLVLAGCAILEALMRMWPCPRLRVADRGLREGILMQLMNEDGVFRSGRRRRRRRGGGHRG